MRMKGPGQRFIQEFFYFIIIIIIIIFFFGGGGGGGGGNVWRTNDVSDRGGYYPQVDMGLAYLEDAGGGSGRGMWSLPHIV